MFCVENSGIIICPAKLSSCVVYEAECCFGGYSDFLGCWFFKGGFVCVFVVGVADFFCLGLDVLGVDECFWGFLHVS